MKTKGILYAVLLFFLIAPLLVACGAKDSPGAKNNQDGDKEEIVLAESEWDSIKFHNVVAKTILEEGYGYPTDTTSGTAAATILGLKKGQIDVKMEVWVSQGVSDVYLDALDDGEIDEVSENFSDQKDGLMVPTYMIEGDPERGIDPIAPDLKAIEDLPDYWELFKSKTDPDKGEIIGSPSSFAANDILLEQMETFNLNEDFEYVSPGSQTAIASTLKKAYDNGDPWVGYYWGPSWLLAKYDMTLLELPEYDEDIWLENKGTEKPPENIKVAVNSDLGDRAPEVVDFLSNYKTSSDLTNEALLYMEENDASPEEAGLWWMKEHMDLWTEWVPEDIADKVKDAIE